ncbi:MAG TPA: hypothetical protein VNM48_03640, partial [Chloroflexota bacterium]|nr:hypothetical protein [Chloroflexota bacterium]
MRLYVFDNLLRRGQLYPRWWPDLAIGYGYPLLHFYSPGLYYLGEALVLSGSSVFRALQWAGVMAVLAGATGAFALGAVLFRQPLASLILSAAYVGAPYPFVTTLYQRSALPEALGLGILPWTLCAAWLTVSSSAWWAPLVFGCLLALIVLTHSLGALVAAGLLLVWLGGGLWVSRSRARWRVLLRGLQGVAFGLSLSAWFWLPAISDRSAVHTELGNEGNLDPVRSLYHPFRQGVTLQEMAAPVPYLVTQGMPFDAHWTYPHARHGVPGPAKPGLGQALLLAGAVVSGVLAMRTARVHTIQFKGHGNTGPSDAIKVATVAGAALSILWFMQLTWSEPLWRRVPLLPTLQFPWRLLGPFGLLVGVAAAGIFAAAARAGLQQWTLALLLTAFLVVNGASERASPDRIPGPPVLPPWNEQLRFSETSERIGSGTTSTGEFLPRSVTLPAPVDLMGGWHSVYEGSFPSGGWQAGRVWPYAGTASIKHVWDAPDWTEALVHVTGPGQGTVAFRTLVFPGWTANVDGTSVPLRPAPRDSAIGIGYGFALVDVPPGLHRVRLSLDWTLSTVLGTALSTLGLSAVIALYARNLLRDTPLSRRPPPRLIGAVVLAAACLVIVTIGARQLLPQLRTPHAARADDGAIVLDFLDERVPLQISSPSGTSFGAFVHVDDVLMAHHRRRWLYMHPPSEVRADFIVPP